MNKLLIIVVLRGFVFFKDFVNYFKFNFFFIGNGFLIQKKVIVLIYIKVRYLKQDKIICRVYKMLSICIQYMLIFVIFFI